MQKVSKLFCPALVTPRNAIIRHAETQSRSHKLLVDLGLVKPTNNGTFQLMPLAQRALDKCIDLLQQTLKTLQAQKVTLPILTASALWEKSGRLNADITEFFMLRDRHNKQFLLSPTHEEAVTALLATASPISHRQLPIRLYQIGNKFRDELKARFGLLRAKEFLMKDLYTFDRSLVEARETYAQVQVAYEQFLRQLQVPFVKVDACTGMMGGELSHEFHYISDIGEDNLLQCKDCGHAANIELLENANCIKCKNQNTVNINGIEIAHTFLLGDKYTRAFNAQFLAENGKPQPMMMGCYGIGLTRLLAAALEVLSTDTQLRWPMLFAPYDVCIIGAKQGSKEQAAGADLLEQQLCQALNDLNLTDDAIHDDRKYLSIGKRLLESKRLGYPLIVVIGSKATEANNKLLELHTYNQTLELTYEAVLSEIVKYRQNKQQLLQHKVKHETSVCAETIKLSS